MQNYFIKILLINPFFSIIAILLISNTSNIYTVSAYRLCKLYYSKVYSLSAFIKRSEQLFK